MIVSQFWLNQPPATSQASPPASRPWPARLQRPRSSWPIARSASHSNGSQSSSSPVGLVSSSAPSPNPARALLRQGQRAAARWRRLISSQLAASTAVRLKSIR